MTNPSFPRLVTHAKWTSIWAALAAFGLYTCMYALRKPFTASNYDNIWVWDYHYKVVLVLAQTLGYMCSKFIGIRLISEQNGQKRAFSLLSFMLIAWFSLLGFALVPPPYNFFFLFLNGLPLGMIWGLVFSYLEGRKTTEFMGAILAVTFIFSSGWVKSIGKWVIVQQIATTFWMPFVVGGFFMLPLLICIFILEKIPPPTPEDIVLRSPRKPMSQTERKVILKEHGWGIFFLVFTYVLLTIHRDIRDNFAANIWTELGLGDNVKIFTQTEIPISLTVLLLLSLFIFIKKNYVALLMSHIFVIIGLLLAGISTLLFHYQITSPFYWMTSVGLGLYMGYIPFNILFFERLLATFKYAGNVGFLMYIADAFGYLGSMGVLCVKEGIKPDILWYKLFEMNTYFIAGVGIIMMLISMVYFHKKNRLQT